MFSHFTRRIGLVLVVLLLVSTMLTAPVAAQTITVTGSVGGCSATISLSINVINDPTLLLDSDFGIVLYDDDSAAFAYASISTSGVLSSLNLGLSYTTIAQPAAGTMTGKLYAVNPPANSVAAITSGTLIATVTFAFNDLEACTGIEVTDGSIEITIAVDDDDGPKKIFFDGRLNSFDTGNPVVLFPVEYSFGEWGLHVYDTDGNLVLEITPEAIAAIEECPEENTVILENAELGVSFYRLSSCEFTLMAPTGEPGKWYVITFDALGANVFYVSFEVFLQ